jgi:hypothetical protein
VPPHLQWRIGRTWTAQRKLVVVPKAGTQGAGASARASSAIGVCFGRLSVDQVDRLDGRRQGGQLKADFEVRQGASIKQIVET